MFDALLNRKLLHFVAVYEARNIARAAQNTHISQPALSMSLRQLEEGLGDQLFHRKARGVVPTETGEVLYRYACSMRHSARLAGEEIAALTSGSLSLVRLGAGVAWTTTVLPDVLIDLQTRFPGMSIDLVTGVGDQLAELFLTGEIDAFLAAGSMPRLDASDIEKAFIANLPMQALVDRNHPLARQKAIKPADLAEYSWAGFYEDEGFVHLAQHHMALHGLPAPKIAIRTNSVAALTTLVRASDMITILISPLARAACEAGLSELRLEEALWDMPVNIYYRKTAADLSAIRIFRDKVSEAIRAIA